ncbi:MAG: nuclear transport factor 2 family protein [Chloroflexi bacterium]|nr:nuclear transport factor 2 family protein [Chloroflexota bacterium]
MDALWARIAPVRCIHPGWNVLSGRDPVMESWRGILANSSQPKIIMAGASVDIFGNLAVVICRELVAGTPLAATNIFTLEDGAWRLVHHHSGPVSFTPD